MMLDRDKITFWTRLGAIALAVIFVGSFVFMGVGSSINLNLLDLLGGNSGAQEDQQQTTSSEEQITQAQQELDEDPENPRIIRRLAGLYIQNGQTDQAVQVLESGREVAPDDPVIALYLGQAYEREAQAQTDEEERKATYKQAGDAYAAAAELQEDKPQAYLAAGQAYEQAGDKGRAIEYWNGYLRLDPEGEQADAVKERISNLIEGEETTGGMGGPKADTKHK
jgi:cytochrome c-type biogenesis protein CcmH/NrfG